jgi:hypothetical protein
MARGERCGVSPAYRWTQSNTSPCLVLACLGYVIRVVDYIGSRKGTRREIPISIGPPAKTKTHHSQNAKSQIHSQIANSSGFIAIPFKGFDHFIKNLRIVEDPGKKIS